MFRKILVAVDGSEHSRQAADAAIALANGMKAEVLGLVHVRPDPQTWIRTYGFEVAAYGGTYESVMASLANAARRLLAEEAERARAALQGTRVAIHDEAGSVVPSIVEVIRREQYDLLVMGSRGMGRAAGLLLGSVSQALLARLPCSVLVVKAEGEATPAGA